MRLKIKIVFSGSQMLVIQMMLNPRSFSAYVCVDCIVCASVPRRVYFICAHV